MKKTKRHILAAVITIIGYIIMDYIFLPVYNIYSPQTWTWLVLTLFAFSILDMMLVGALKFNSSAAAMPKKNSKGKSVISLDEGYKGRHSLGSTVFIAALVIAVIGVVCFALSSTMFHAKSYAAIAGDIETRDFISDTPPSENISDIALMDTNSARIIGSRALGSLSDLVSQFEINNNYTQINYNDKPLKVSSLEYADFFKWMSNREQGVPGYVSVSPVANTSSYVKLDVPMKYVPSAYFGDNLYRKLRFTYRTAMFGSSFFEIDDEGVPYYITPVLKHSVFLFGGLDVKGVVTLNPSTGETQYYDVGEVPTWIDIVYSGYMLTERYDWYGMYSGGFWNSIIGNKDCKRTTDDFGYKMFDDDVWVFTGVTSIVSDESNIGFVLMNSRTAEIRYYAIPGAEEYSVMSSAEGEVQHLGYTASFPSVINVENQPTYIMVLKDKGSLVKQYALIHVERYNIVATGNTQQEVMAKYKTALAQNGLLEGGGVTPDNSIYDSVKVKDIKFLVQDGNTYAYAILDDGRALKIDSYEYEIVVLIEPGDEIQVVIGEEENGVYPVLDLKLE